MDILRAALAAAVVALAATFHAVAAFAAAGADAAAATSLSYYLPAGVSYADDVPPPSSVLGWEVGEWHVRHDQLLGYLRELAARSDRVDIETIGSTHEQRDLVHLVISSPENLARLGEIFTAHRRLSDPSQPPPDTSAMPVVVYLGYSIHGNEASGSNASLLVAYHLAAGRSEEVGRWLDNAVILIDPSLNPDGLGRFAQWANMHRGRVLVADPLHREHREGWPNGRTNHYWFDLNRDWLLAQHPESQARLAEFHRRRPNVQADFHEMDTGSTYFFQPGVPSRQNPLTPAKNLELTHVLADYHARALDAAGSLYFTEERFDDFYFGKGSTYPDLHGAVGILFEQASARGHLQDSKNGPLAFPFAIRNQFLTSLSTLRGAVDKRRELLDYQIEFYRSALQQATADDLEAYVFGEPADAARTFHLLELLHRHRIEVYKLGADAADGLRFRAGEAYAVPLGQPQYRLVRALFEKRVDFADTTFYDVSTWTAPLAFDVPYLGLSEKRPGLLGERLDEPAFPAGRFPQRPTASAGGEVVAYAFDWDAYYAPRTLYTLLAARVRARVATQPFTGDTLDGPREFSRGTIVVPTGGGSPGPERIAELLQSAAHRDAVTVHALTGGLTPAGVDLGSPAVRPLKLPKPALVVGRGAGTYAAGEIWHLLDARFGIPLPMIEAAAFDDANLGAYTHLVLVNGEHKGLSAKAATEIRRWVQQGGIVVALQKAAVWADEQILHPSGGEPSGEEPSGEEPSEEASTRSTESRSAAAGDGTAAQPEPPVRRAYGDHPDDRAAQLISGAIFEVELDLTHPLAFGYRREKLPVFRNSRVFLQPSTDPYTTVAVYSESPLLSGYVSEENHARLRRTPALVAERLGRGAVIRMVDTPNFRAYWYGTNKLFLNALFFGQVIDDTALP